MTMSNERIAKNIYIGLKLAYLAIKMLLIAVILIYASVYIVNYAKAQRGCLTYLFEHTYLTYDLKPYCGSLVAGSMVVESLSYIAKVEQQLHPNAAPGASY